MTIKTYYRARFRADTYPPILADSLEGLMRTISDRHKYLDDTSIYTTDGKTYWMAQYKDLTIEKVTISAEPLEFIYTHTKDN